MKSFKQYLTEGRRTYDFRVRIADTDLTAELLDKIERGLGEFELVDITKPKSMPVARTTEFTKLGPVARQQFEIKLNYPTIPPALIRNIHVSSGIAPTHIAVYNALDDSMDHLDHSQHEEGPILNNEELPTVDKAQDTVGEKRVTSLLAELGKEKYGGEQYKGINDDILAKAAHVDPKAKTTNDFPMGTTSPVGTNKNKLQPSRTGSKI